MKELSLVSRYSLEIYFFFDQKLLDSIELKKPVPPWKPWRSGKIFASPLEESLLKPIIAYSGLVSVD